MSLSSEMSAVVHALASASSARRHALKCIRHDTKRHLADARTNRRRAAAEQQALRSEALRSNRLATAIVLGAADELIDEVHRQRIAQTARLKRTLADGAKQLRTQTRKWLNQEAVARKKSDLKARRERTVYRTALRSEVAVARKHFRGFLAMLSKDRCGAGAIWQLHAAGGNGAAAAQRENALAVKQAAEAAAKRDAASAAKREAETAVKREAEAKAKREAATSSPVAQTESP